MSDPRLNGSHLDVARHDQYDAEVDALLDDRGPLTSAADPLARPLLARLMPVRRTGPPAGGTYTLVASDGCRHPLRVGINAIGRFPENDLVLTPNHISRRHCVVLVHATGGCEVYDTASRNGTWVNRHRVLGPAELLPGDVLMLCDQKFLVAWVGPDGEAFPAAEQGDTLCSGSPSTTD
jgi:pSer/pThr/pTyr-binding forkhead associated (FHA) protein